MIKVIMSLLVCLFILPANIKAQDCKFDTKEKDKFSGTTKLGNWYQLGTELLSIIKTDDKITLEIESTSRGAMQQGVAKGDVGQIRLANGEMVSFTAAQNAEPVVKVNGTGTDYNSSIKVKYDMTVEELTKLASSVPVAMKVMLGSKEVVKEFSDKKGEKIRAGARCMLDYKE